MRPGDTASPVQAGTHLRPDRNRKVMDDAHRSHKHQPHIPVAKPHRQPAALPERKADFAPLQLVLVPSGMTVELRKTEQTIGRHSDSDIRLPLGDVSRRHCKIIHADDTWEIIDLDSLNGTFVNNQRVRQAVLRHGDRIRIGSFLLEVRMLSAGTMSPQIYDTRRAS
jgi:pSer/pThr/pTyr-binding forkhead associated (FHA) protein